MKKSKDRLVRVAAVQGIAGSKNRKDNINKIINNIGEVSNFKPDLVVLSELCTTQYFCTDYDQSSFDLAETIPGYTTDVFSEKAKEIKSYILIPMFEKTIEGEFYNSAVLIGPDGSIVKGKMEDGSDAKVYRKNHLPANFDLETGQVRMNEKLFFKPGAGFPVFHTSFGVIGILLCWDKRFSEAWRILSLLGAEIILNPLTTFGSWRAKMYTLELQAMAMNNQVFVIGCGRGGVSPFNRSIEYAGGCSIIDPWGSIISEAEPGEGFFSTAEINLRDVERARRSTLIYRDRRPELYSLLTK